jgi:hypothetical protein
VRQLYLIDGDFYREDKQNAKAILNDKVLRGSLRVGPEDTGSTPKP